MDDISELAHLLPLQINSMFLSTAHTFTEKSLQYEEMIRDCNHLTGRALEIKKLEIDEVAKVLQEMRERLNQIAPEKLYFTKHG